MYQILSIPLLVLCAKKYQWCDEVGDVVEEK